MTDIILSALILVFACAAAALLRLWLVSDRARREQEHRCLSAEQSAAAERDRHAQEKEALLQQHSRELEYTRRLHEQEMTALNTRLKEQREEEQRRGQEQERRYEESRKAMVDQFKTLAGEVLNERAKQLKNDNGEQMDAILTPLREQLEGLGKAVTASRTESAANKAALESTIREMMLQTQQIGKEAVNLTNALKGNSKTQGDWGEMILERMLEQSGLQRDVHYSIQESVRDENAKIYRPDVILRFPRERSVIIDSKVSLNAYAEYTAATDEAARQSALKAHLLSVRKHIDELAAKDYGKVVKDSIGYVLMFIPNEASYITAVQAQADLPLYAFRQGVLMVSPTNLLMAIQLADNLWRNEAQVQNVEAIYDRATQLYEKFQGFQADFINAGEKMRAALAAYDAADNKLSAGRGNFVRQVEMLRDLGVKPNPKKRLVLQDDGEEA